MGVDVMPRLLSSRGPPSAEAIGEAMEELFSPDNTDEDESIGVVEC